MYNPYYSQNQQPQVSYMSTRGKDAVISFPIAPGNTIIFKDETAPYVYIKAMGYSSLDSPTLEVYKREEPQQMVQIVNEDNKLQEDIDRLFEEIEGIKKKLNAKPTTTATTVRKKGANDDTK